MDGVLGTFKQSRRNDPVQDIWNPPRPIIPHND